MTQDKVELLFVLLRSAIRGNKIQDKEKKSITSDICMELFEIAKRHDIAPLLVYGLEANAIYCVNNEIIKNESLMAIYRYERQNFEYNRICNALEDAQIPFIPLKGSVIRKYYPEPWMRTSCDIDILMQAIDVEKTADYLVSNCGCTRMGAGSHEISLFTPNKVHIELHYELVEEGLVNASSEVLKSVWQSLTLYNNKKYWHEMTDEMFYFYHISHMVKHFQIGGCGIRPYIDLWILDNIDSRDQEKRDKLLERGELLKFAETARLLSRVWFNNEEHTELSKQMENYILCGGVYGSIENRVAVQQQKKGGRLKYAISKIFIPYDVIKFHYPILHKHRWLMPIMEVRRWFKLVFFGHAKRIIHELNCNGSISSDEATNMQAFLKDIGL